MTGKDNLTAFTYSGRVKSPEWRRQLRRADLRQILIFRHGPIIIYTRLPTGGTYYPICVFRTNSERLISISDAFSAFVYGYPSSCPRAHCTPQKSATTLCYTRRFGPALYTGHACRHLPSAVPWISEDRLLRGASYTLQGAPLTVIDYRPSYSFSQVFFSPGSAVCAGSYFDVRSTPVLLQYTLLGAPQTLIIDLPYSFSQVFFSTVSSLCWLLFRYPFHARVIAVHLTGGTTITDYRPSL